MNELLNNFLNFQPYKIIKASKEARNNMLKTFLSFDNNEYIIKEFDFEQYASEGLPLKYSRVQYILDLKSVLKQINENESETLSNYIGITLTEEGFEKFPVIINQIPSDFTVEMKNALEIINIFTQNFTLNNSVTIEDEQPKFILENLIKGLPEFTTVIGKPQHKTHKYTVDIHILSVLQKAIKNPLYKELSDTDKMALKFAIILHDFGKRGAIIDEGHAILSAHYAIGILDKFDIDDNLKFQIISLVKNHHLLGKYNKQEVDKNYIASFYKDLNDFKIAKIFAKADVSSVNDYVHLKWYNSCGEEEFEHDFENKMNEIIN